MATTPGTRWRLLATSAPPTPFALLGGALIAMIGYVGVPAEFQSFFLGTLALFASVCFVIACIAWRQRYVTAALKAEPYFHAHLNFVMPLRQYPNSLVVLVNVVVENRGGVPSELRDWELWANVAGVPTRGVFSSALAEDSIEIKAGKIDPGTIRSGAYAGAFTGATI